MENSIESGDLVHLFMYSPHDSALACTPFHSGIFLDHDHDAYEVAWIILVNGEVKSFSRNWWKLRLFQKNK